MEANYCLKFLIRGLINLVKNQRNVTMAAYGKSIGGIYPVRLVPVLLGLDRVTQSKSGL